MQLVLCHVQLPSISATSHIVSALGKVFLQNVCLDVHIVGKLQHYLPYGVSHPPLCRLPVGHSFDRLFDRNGVHDPSCVTHYGNDGFRWHHASCSVVESGEPLSPINGGLKCLLNSGGDGYAENQPASCGEHPSDSPPSFPRWGGTVSEVSSPLPHPYFSCSLLLALRGLFFLQVQSQSEMTLGVASHDQASSSSSKGTITLNPPCSNQKEAEKEERKEN